MRGGCLYCPTLITVHLGLFYLHEYRKARKSNQLRSPFIAPWKLWKRISYPFEINIEPTTTYHGEFARHDFLAALHQFEDHGAQFVELPVVLWTRRAMPLQVPRKTLFISFTIIIGTHSQCVYMIKYMFISTKINQWQMLSSNGFCVLSKLSYELIQITNISSYLCSHSCIQMLLNMHASHW